MKHEPSNYTGTIDMTVQQMMEVHKAIRARVTYLLLEAEDRYYPHKKQDLMDLMAVASMLEEHEQKALEEWETRVAAIEAGALDDIGAIEEFLRPADGE